MNKSTRIIEQNQLLQGYDLSELGFDYSKYQKCITYLDKDVLSKHNAKYPKGSKKYLHEDLTPCPFEGNLLNARIYLLLLNPGVSESSTQLTHNLRVKGWGIANLSLESKSTWYRKRFSTLLNDPEDENEWMQISNKIAMIQAIPWASKNDPCIEVPSSSLMMDTVSELAKIRNDSIFIIMRRKKFWVRALQKIDSSRIIYSRNPRCAHISEGNFGNGWKKIKQLLINS